jgi:isopenicillin-N epimerase
MSQCERMSSASNLFAQHWSLDPAITFLNHGSFGACLRKVLAKQREFIDRMEAEPVRFFIREAEPLLDASRADLGAFLGADSNDLVFVPNATAGINAVLRSLTFEAGDELLTTNHAYNACKNALQYAAERRGAKIVVATVPFPIANSGEIASVVLNAVTSRTKLALLDHVTSPTAILFPVAEIVSDLAQRGIDTLIDGAHAPGMIPLNISAIGSAYYTGNCHKWVCAPKGAGFLHVRRDKQSAIRPLSISHGANSTRTDRSRFQIEFNWTGTDDVSPYLCVPVALREMASLVQGGWPEIMRRNHDLAIQGRQILCRELGIEPPCPAELLGSMATLPLPGNADGPPNLLGTDPLQDKLLFKHNIEVPIVGWSTPRRMVRISAQLYNQLSDYEKLAATLKA